MPDDMIPTAPLAEVQVVRKSSAGMNPHQPPPAPAPAPIPGEAVSVEGRGAGFRRQAGALYRKNAVYQRRNWCSNCCLLSAPVFFCLMLFGIQIAINKLLLTGEDYGVSRAILPSRGRGYHWPGHGGKEGVHLRDGSHYYVHWAQSMLG